MRADSPAALQALRSWSSDEERQSRLRPASLTCRALLRGMLAEMTQSSPDAWRFSKQDSGALVAAHPGSQPVPAISISHSGTWVAYAATFAGAIGIDVEERELHARLGRYAFLHRAVRGLSTAPAALERFIRMSLRPCLVPLARYLFTHDEVLDRVYEQTRQSRGLRNPECDSPLAMRQALTQRISG